MAATAHVTFAHRTLALACTHEAYKDQLDGARLDQTLLAKLANDLGPSPVYLDVGANVGLTAITVALARPDCRVLAFEPVPSNLRHLRENVTGSGATNIEIVDAAVGEETAASVYLSDNGPWSTVQPSGAVSTRSLRLDDVAVDRVDLIKMDIEGYEPNAICGAKRLLESTKPLIYLEFNSWALLLHHYDALTFARILWQDFDVIGMDVGDSIVAAPSDHMMFVHDNIVRFGCVNNLLLRPRAKIPDLHVLTDAPATAALRQQMRGAHRQWTLHALRGRLAARIANWP
jgi:FkbM family methyltransferase